MRPAALCCRFFWCFETQCFYFPENYFDTREFLLHIAHHLYYIFIRIKICGGIYNYVHNLPTSIITVFSN
jgi:hypothetical protein